MIEMCNILDLYRIDKASVLKIWTKLRLIQEDDNTKIIFKNKKGGKNKVLLFSSIYAYESTEAVITEVDAYIFDVNA
jgi:hypothetical protein